MADHTHMDAIVQRIIRQLDAPELLEKLAGLSGSDLTSLLMAVMDARSATVTPHDVLARIEVDRFVRSSDIDLRALHRVERSLLESVPDTFDTIELAPQVPFGTHAALGGTPQNNVVSTIRQTEVAADPTSGLALIAAARRASQSAHERVRLATLQRVTRAQPFTGPLSFAHFSLLGLVSSGRDPGGHRFEIDEAATHIRTMVDGALACGAESVVVRVSDFSGRRGTVVEEIVGAVGTDRAVASVDRDRTQGKGYYPGICFKVHVDHGENSFEFGDGGFVDWGARLRSDRKERMMISGASVDRLAV